MCDALSGTTDGIVSSPVLVMKTFGIPKDVLNDVEALIVTSPLAVNVLAHSPVSKLLPVFAVGKDSAMAALRAGFAEITNGGGTAKLLLRTIDRANLQRGLYVSAQHVSRDLSKDRPESVSRHVAYEMIPANDLSPAAVIALKADEPVIIPFYSPRSLQIFESLVSKKNLPSFLSKATAVLIHARLKNNLSLSWGRTHVAPTADGVGMITAIREAV